jgi:hypothetical protein
LNTLRENQQAEGMAALHDGFMLKPFPSATNNSGRSDTL